MSEYAFVATVAIVGIALVSIVAIVYGQKMRSSFGKFKVNVGDQNREKRKSVSDT